MLPEDLKQFLVAFNDHGVEYLVVGGYAVGIYAEARATKDPDLFVKVRISNNEAVYRALSAYCAPVSGLSSADFRDDPYSVFQIGVPPAGVDILQRVDDCLLTKPGQILRLLRSAMLP
jgi:hypothetical protein